MTGVITDPASNLPQDDLPKIVVTTLALARTVRLVSTARLRDPVLLKLVDAALLDDLAEIEGATSGRLLAERQGADDIAKGEFVAGMLHAAFINAAFAYFRPRELNRFNGPGRGAWYAALDVATCIAEVSFHMTRELERVHEFSATVDYAEMLASFAGAFCDLREANPTPMCLSSNTAVAYPAGNSLADIVRTQGLNGIVYPSVRAASGTCLVALWPHAVQSVAQGKVLRFVWDGTRNPIVTEMTG